MNAALKVSREYGDTIPLSMLAIADNSKVETYTRAITEEERSILSSGVTEISIKEEDVAEEKKEQVAMYNADLKKFKLEKKSNLRALRTGRTEVAEMVHTFLDTENGKTHKYDAHGNLISTRRMTPTEAQLQIK